MASGKRSRRALDDEDFEVVDVESAQSSLQQDSRKKPRISYHDNEEQGSDDELEDDELEAEATQVLTQQRNRIKEGNMPADNGILQSVTCTNFMCHTHLEVTLGALINFIIGHNGSGKSAVLTAITICLGGKATTTNRGQSLKSFIKEGEESAVLSVKIKNTGASAYSTEVYGDAIIVERHFSRSGGSTFKLKSSAGKIISNRKGDLDEICDYYALQIDNPMNVLTQDMARQFLNSSTPSDKYKFFMKGTQLEHLDGDYHQMEQSIDQLETELVTVEQDVQHYQKEAEGKKALVALSEKHDSLRRKFQNLSFQMAWTQVEQAERDLESHEGELRMAEEAITGAEGKESEASETYDSLNHTHEVAMAAIKEVEDSLAPLNEEKEQVKEVFDQCKKEAMEIQAQQRQIRGLLKDAEARIRTTKADVQDEYRRLGDIDGGNNARRLTEIEEKKGDAAAAKERLRQHERSIGALEEDQRTAQKILEESRAPIMSKKSEIQEQELRLDGLLRDRGQPQGAYPASMPRLLRAIEQDGGFRQLPVGPIGKHVRLLNPVWSKVLEKFFGGALNSFIVTSKEDQNRLSNLMQQHRCQCPVIIGNNVPITITDHEPDPEFETTLRVLDIDNELVQRQLIIGQAIEQTILIKDRAEAVDRMNSGRLRNVKQCLTFNQKGVGQSLRYGYAGSVGQNSIGSFNGVPRMKTDVEYQINSQRDTIQRLRSELNNLEREARENQNAVKKCGEAIVRHNRETRDLRLAIQKADDVVDNLQDALDKDAIEEGRLEALKANLVEAEDERATHAGSFEESVIASDNAKASMREKREQMAAMDARIEEVVVKINKAQGRSAKTQDQRQKALQQKNAAIESVTRAKDAFALKETEHGEKAETLKEFTGLASDICDRVPVDAGETTDSLDKKLAKLDADVKRFDKQLGGDPQKIAEDAVKAVEQAVQAETQASSMRALAQALKMALMSRREAWCMFQRAITARARVLFAMLLSERRFRGKLVVDHKGKTLDLNVEPDETQMRSGGRKTKTLSGGEKSFSTTCLLLSLWEAMGSPVRCLDEFDVFMDSANREVSMNLMISAARGSASRQFIFITPGAMGNVSDARDIKIHRMTDPERGQRTLPFASA